MTDTSNLRVIKQKYMVLDIFEHPIKCPKDDEGSDDSYIFYSLIEACAFAQKEKKNQDAVEVVEIISLDRQGSGM